MTPTHVNDPDDPRIAAFRNVKERDLTGRQGLFVAEGEVVLRVLASEASRCAPVSVLIAEKRLENLREVLERLPGDVPVHVAPQAVLNAVAGFDLHRGILALGCKPEVVDPGALLDSLPERAVVVVACGIGNHDNMGGLFRNAAAFGAGAVLLDRTCCDPFYRKAIRVSVGAALRTPMATGLEAEAMIDLLQDRSFEVLALTPSADQTLAELKPGRRTALLLGSEGPGLPRDLIARCHPVGIRMAGGFDSLNVAATSAVALHHLTTAGAG
ncbi:RNA methyltransferase [Brevundimonas sp. 3P9-tot-E]|uniref:TrmH family RNA methyltransferase n=1 Tax=Brevundimonas TaxID=41275 RepID=UPI0019057B61|nr:MULTISPECIES: RNA methyltransferase [Brevundimonas]MDA0742293.1 RNA methyltransferase [Pseudomonadota bacterium]MBK1967781.1 RNA methyltransferase [Brevundimonas diminuta]MBK1975355.1 RNA methyltransferase [Brevundimonas diminuta]MDA1322087.1 RNA methyltransferase [Pseudomonadota bacterium]MDM8353415.1 RNA methyltransferase [Brevundimonas diminuta]